MINYLTALFFAARSIFIGCPFDKSGCTECDDYKYGAKKIGRLPKEVHESSGLALYDDLFITHPDSGNPPKLWGVKYPFEVDKPINGEINLPPDVKNIDWEDLAQDDQDNLYIGDFGNNDNDRKDLSIIKLNLLENKSELIEFYYPDQKEFPPKRNKEKNYNCEAMLWAKGNLYLFSKNNGNKNVKMYKLPDRRGKYKAEIVDTLRLPLQITGADISPNGQFVILLSYGKILLFRTSYNDEGTLRLTPFNCKQFTKSGQSEGVVFLDEENLIITNERGKVYWMYIKKDKRNKEKRKPELEDLFPQMSEKNLLEIQ